MVKNLLIVEAQGTNWYNIFKNEKLQNGEEIRVEQCGWNEIALSACSERGCHVQISGNLDGFYQQKDMREMKVDFILVRNFAGGLHDQNYKNIVLGFIFAGIPSCNSLQSVILREKPIIYGQLQNISNKLGKDMFSVIPQIYLPNIQSSDQIVLEPRKFPVVAKVGTLDSGAGKIRLKDQEIFEDFLSCMNTGNQYIMLEPFQEVDHDIRLQKIGNHYRCYTRKSLSNWKQNSGKLIFENIEVNEKYKVMMDEVAKINGGLDMFALDLLSLKDGREIVLELNDSAMGLMHEHIEQDTMYIKELCLEKMNNLFKEVSK